MNVTLPGLQPGQCHIHLGGWRAERGQSGVGLVAGERPGQRDHRWMDMRRHAAAADLVFTGGPVYTADAARRSMVAASPAGVGSGDRPGGGDRPDGGDGPPADAVAVRDGRIMAVGGAREIRDLAGPRTEGVDLRGRAL